MQRTYQLVGLKARMESQGGLAISVDCLTAQWNKKITVSSGEAVTHNFVDTALRVHTHVLSHDVVREQILLAPLPI